MEDASDFSWNSAKAAHAIMLTNMEADMVTWPETDKMTGYIGLVSKDILAMFSLLNHVLLPKKNKNKKYWHK